MNKLTKLTPIHDNDMGKTDAVLYESHSRGPCEKTVPIFFSKLHASFMNHANANSIRSLFDLAWQRNILHSKVHHVRQHIHYSVTVTNKYSLQKFYSLCISYRLFHHKYIH